MKESTFSGIKNRVLQLLARILPGAKSLRVFLHKARGVKIGKNVWIGYDVILETSRPYLIEIGNNVSFGIRSTVIAHFKTTKGVKIEDDVYIGPGTIILPNVKIGRGAVISAGSVVSNSVASNTMVRGNPAIPIAKCKKPLTLDTSYMEFLKNLSPIKK